VPAFCPPRNRLNRKFMQASDLDYELPEAAIAQVPAARREDARLLVDRGHGRQPAHRCIADPPGLLEPGDVLVLNDSRVLPARIQLRRPTGGRVEVLLLEAIAENRWEALARPSRKLGPGMILEGDGAFEVEILADLGEGRWLVEVRGDIDKVGELPL